MKVILISGKAQNGKDTVASILKHKLSKDGYSVLVTHYADLLKFICSNYFDWDGQKDEDGRRLLQYVGTDIIRKQNPTLWVDFIAMILGYFKDNWDYVIIPDCRFPNEITKMVESGFDTIHLRVKRTNFESPLTIEQQQHPSETALDDFGADYYIENSSTIENLKHNVELLIEEELYECNKKRRARS